MKHLLVFLFLCLSAPLMANDTVKTYFVKGMHCAGCESSVRQSLKEFVGLADDNILELDHSKPDLKNRIGTLKIKFAKDEYRGIESDCKIVAAIKKNPGYQVYWKEGDVSPCQ